MVINHMRISNFLVFRDDESPSFNESFCEGINVFIGANGTGKSTLLKCIHAACEYSRPKENNISLLKYFSSNNAFLDTEPGFYRIQSGCNEFFCNFVSGYGRGGYGLGAYGGLTYEGTPLNDNDPWRTMNINSILIPSSEMLSHSPGFLALNYKYKIPFDQTQIDILANAQLPETREISDRDHNILKSLSDIIDGDVLYENDTFYLAKRNGLKVEFSLEAEGLRRLGLLWKLIRNGLLPSGSVLLWDEPESSLNPELIPALVKALYKLMQSGVQIFIATHNYFLAKYIEVLNTDSEKLLYLLLYKDNTQHIGVICSKTYANISNNPIEAAEEKLYQAILQKAMEN